MAIPRAYQTTIASGATQTFSDVISLNALYTKIYVTRSAMASMCTIYPQISVTGTTGTFKRVLLEVPAPGAMPIASSATQIFSYDTSVSGYYAPVPTGAQYLRFEVASLPTNGVVFDLIASEE